MVAVGRAGQKDDMALPRLTACRQCQRRVRRRLHGGARHVVHVPVRLGDARGRRGGTGEWRAGRGGHTGEQRAGHRGGVGDRQEGSGGRRPVSNE